MLFDSTPCAHDDSREEAHDAMTRQHNARLTEGHLRDRDCRLARLRVRRHVWWHEAMDDTTATRSNGIDELLDERTADDGDLRVRIALERIESECNADERAFVEGGAICRWHVQLDEAVADLFERGAGRRDVTLEQRPDARVRERLALVGLMRAPARQGGFGDGPPASASLELARRHDAFRRGIGASCRSIGVSTSAERSTSVIGSSSACTTRRTPRPVPVRPLRCVSDRWSVSRSASSTAVASSSASMISPTCSPIWWRFASTPGANCRWFVP